MAVKVEPIGIGIDLSKWAPPEDIKQQQEYSGYSPLEKALMESQQKAMAINAAKRREEANKPTGPTLPRGRRTPPKDIRMAQVLKALENEDILSAIIAAAQLHPGTNR